jgi:hypothetical protein
MKRQPRSRVHAVQRIAGQRISAAVASSRIVITSDCDGRSFGAAGCAIRFSARQLSSEKRSCSRPADPVQLLLLPRQAGDVGRHHRQQQGRLDLGIGKDGAAAAAAPAPRTACNGFRPFEISWNQMHSASMVGHSRAALVEAAR